MHIVIEEGREEEVFSSLSFLIDFGCDLFCELIYKREFSFLFESLSLAFGVQLKAGFDGGVLGDILESLLGSLEINLTELPIGLRIFIKDNLIMRHIIKDFEEHDIAEFFSLVVHDIIIDNVDLLIFE